VAAAEYDFYDKTMETFGELWLGRSPPDIRGRKVEFAATTRHVTFLTGSSMATNSVVERLSPWSRAASSRATREQKSKLEGNGHFRWIFWDPDRRHRKECCSLGLMIICMPKTFAVGIRLVLNRWQVWLCQRQSQDGRACQGPKQRLGAFSKLSKHTRHA
jgi:hypothetical protein